MIHSFHTPTNWPLCLRLGGRYGFAYLKISPTLYLQWNLAPDYDERVTWRWGCLTITRPETDEEREEREYGEAEALALEVEAGRYIEWSY